MVAGEFREKEDAGESEDDACDGREGIGLAAGAIEYQEHQWFGGDDGGCGAGVDVLFRCDDQARSPDEHQQPACAEDLRIFCGWEGKTFNTHPGEQDDGYQGIPEKTEHERRNAEHSKTHSQISGSPDDIYSREGEDEKKPRGAGNGRVHNIEIAGVKLLHQKGIFIVQNL